MLFVVLLWRFAGSFIVTTTPRLTTKVCSQQREAPGLTIPLPTLKTEEVRIEAEDAFAWVEERREFQAMELTKQPRALRGLYRESLTEKRGDEVLYYHSFDVAASPLVSFSDWKLYDDDRSRLELICDLLEGVAYLHGRGLPHLSLNAKSVYLSNGGLRVLGVGAGPKLVATKRPFAIPEDWPFNPPETANAGIIQSNLRALLTMDAWSVGVLVVMLATHRNRSPFAAEPDWRYGIFDERAAVAKKTTELIRENLASFLRHDLNTASNGLIFRQGFLVHIILGLLEMDPAKRMTVAEARDIARDAFPRGQQQRREKPKELGRFGPNVTVSRSGEPFRSLEAIVNVCEAGSCTCILEDRQNLPGTPYGEVIGYRNRGDGDRWDVLVPGTSCAEDLVIGNAYSIRRVLGVVLVKGGNHKLAVELDGYPSSRDLMLRDVDRFIDSYTADKRDLARSRVRFLEYDSR